MKLSKHFVIYLKDYELMKKPSMVKKMVSLKKYINNINEDFGRSTKFLDDHVLSFQVLRLSNHCNCMLSLKFDSIK